MSKTFAALNARSNEIALVAGRWNKSGDYAIEGFSRSPSRGINKGVVTDVAMATDSIAQALEKLREKTGKKIHEVYAGISSSSIDIIPSRGVVVLSKYGREVTTRDIAKCIKVGSIVKLPLEKEALHRVVNGFTLDDEKRMKNPMNLEGVKLSAELDIITINSTVLRNLTKSINLAGYTCSGFVFTGFASALRILSKEDKEEGAVLLDIGEDLTEMLIFDKDILIDCKAFNIGTKDLVSRISGIDKNKVNYLCSKLFKQKSWSNSRRVVIAGEGALAENLIESFEEALYSEVKAGTCSIKPFEDLPADRIGYASCLGILDHFHEQELEKRHAGNIAKRAVNRILSFIDSYF